MMEYKIPLLPPDMSKEVQDTFMVALATTARSPQGSLDSLHQALKPFFPDHQTIGLNSCIAALHIGLRLLGYKPATEFYVLPLFLLQA